MLGVGATACVVRVEDLDLGTEAVVKAPNRKRARDPAVARSLIQEAGMTLRLADCAGVRALGEFGAYRGVPYLVFPFAPAKSYEDLLRRRIAFAEPEALSLMIPIIETVGDLWDRGWLAQDLKLDNFLLRFDGTVNLADHGLTRAISKSGDIPDGVTGSRVRAAPEYFDFGSPRRRVGQWSAVYTLGVNLRELLLGGHGFSIDTFVSLKLSQAVPVHFGRLRGVVSRHLFDLIVRMVDPDPARRPTLKQCAQRMRRLLANAALTPAGRNPPFARVPASCVSMPGIAADRIYVESPHVEDARWGTERIRIVLRVAVDANATMLFSSLPQDGQSELVRQGVGKLVASSAVGFCQELVMCGELDKFNAGRLHTPGRTCDKPHVHRMYLMGEARLRDLRSGDMHPEAR